MNNTAEILEQFIVEARECLETIGQRLLQIERDPGNPALLNDLFRSVHTLKGNCGMFEFGALERIVHAGEDVLDRVRAGALPYSGEMADALLAAMDHSAELIDTIASTGSLPASATPRSQDLAAALRAFLPSADSATAAAAPAAAVPAAPKATQAALPDWIAALPADWQRAGATVLRYQPEPECFFKGEDPWSLVQQTPDLQDLRVLAPEDWGPADQFDCYQCRLGFLVLSNAPLAYVQDHYRYVPEQCEWHVQPEAAVAETLSEAHRLLLRRRATELWSEQLILLERQSQGPGTVAAVAQVLAHLLPLLAPEGTVAPPMPAPALSLIHI